MDISEEAINQITANVLEAAARESGLNQRSLAERSGMSLVTVQKLLSGRQSVKMHQFYALVAATDLSPTDVMDRVDAAIARHLAPKRPARISLRDGVFRIGEDVVSGDEGTVEPVEKVTHLGDVTPPVRAAADTKDRTPSRD